MVATGSISLRKNYKMELAKKRQRMVDTRKEDSQDQDDKDDDSGNGE